MNEPKPCFELTRIFEDGTQEPAGLVPVTKLSGVRMNRRGFLGTAITLGGVVTLTGCSSTWEALKSWWNEMGRRYEGSQACGTPIPSGAICTCNCVSGGGSYGTRCTCDQVCTCVPVSR